MVESFLTEWRLKNIKLIFSIQLTIGVIEIRFPFEIFSAFGLVENPYCM